MTIVSTMIKEMILFEEDNLNRINHFLKVYGFAKVISEMEGIDKETQDILEIAAIMHDIGMKISLERHNSSIDFYQEKEGPRKARQLMELHGVHEDKVDRVCYLIGNHKTYTNIDGIDYQILVEADFLVNIHEGKMYKDMVMHIRENVFKTKSGIYILDLMLNLCI